MTRPCPFCGESELVELTHGHKEGCFFELMLCRGISEREYREAFDCRVDEKPPVVYTKEAVEHFLSQLESQKHDAAMKYKKSFDQKTINDECVRYGVIQEIICEAETHFKVKSKETDVRQRMEAAFDKKSRTVGS